MNRLLIKLQQVSIMLLISAIYSCGGGDELAPPERLNVSNVSVTGLTLSWNDQELSLQVQVSESADFSNIALDQTFETSPSIVMGLKSATTYYFRARSISGGSVGGFSEGEEFTTIPLTAPSTLSVGTILGDAIGLSWPEVLGATYEVDVALDDQFTQYVSGYEQLISSVNSINVEVLEPLTEYFIRVRSVNGEEKSDYTPVSSVTTTDLLIFTLQSSAFTDNGTIPNEFACAGPSPPLNWRNPPTEAASLALIMCDLDFRAGVYNHWIVYNISPGASGLERGASGSNVAGGGREATNGLGQQRYFGPCPPAGESHRYTFTLYALDSRPSINAQTTINSFRTLIAPHIITSSSMTANFGQ